MKSLSTILIALVIMLTTGGVANATLFKDVPTDSWAYNAFSDLEKAGLVEGYPPWPGQTFTRYEMAMVTTRLFSKLEREGGGDKLTFEQTLEFLGLGETFDDELAELGVNLKEPMTKLADENIFEPAIGNHPPEESKGPTKFEDVPYSHWSYQALFELKKAVGFEVYPDYTPPGPLTRYEMAMNIISVYRELAKPYKHDRFSLKDTKKLFALTADFAPELCFLVNLGNDSIRIRETIIWLAKNRTLVTPSAGELARHSMFKDISFDSWVYPAIESFVLTDYIEGYPGYYDGHLVKPERSFTRYEFGMVTARIYTKLNYGYYSSLTDAEILRLLALSSEFAMEMDKLGFDCRQAMLALLGGRLFLPDSQDTN